MRGILAIAIGAAFLALALGLFRLDEDLPIALRWVIGIFSVIVMLAGASHLRLRFRRQQAYSNGRQKRGTARLYRPLRPDSDEITAIVIFATDRSQWMMTLDLGSISGLESALADGVNARAWLGNDGNIYALDIGKKRTMPVSAGVPLTPKLQKKIDWAEQKMARAAEKHASRKG